MRKCQNEQYLPVIASSRPDQLIRTISLPGLRALYFSIAVQERAGRDQRARDGRQDGGASGGHHCRRQRWRARNRAPDVEAVIAGARKQAAKEAAALKSIAEGRFDRSWVAPQRDRMMNG